MSAFAYVHGGYIGKAKVRIDGTGNLTVALNDTFLPHVLAVVDTKTPE